MAVFNSTKLPNIFNGDRTKYFNNNFTVAFRALNKILNSVFSTLEVDSSIEIFYFNQ